MKSTHFRIFAAILAIVLLLALSVGVYAANDGIASKDGLTVSLSTDKESYTSGEQIRVDLDITNNSGKTANIVTEVKIPAGLALASGSTTGTAVLKNGENKVAAVTLNVDTPAKTGDSSQLVLWLIVCGLAACGVIAMACFSRNARSVISMVLCFVLVCSVLLTAVPARAEAGVEGITVSKTVMVNDAEETITASVSYTLEEEEAVETVYTRNELEDALVASAWAYYLKGDKLQYCSQEITNGLNKYYGGTYRLTEDAAPEYGTADTTIYSVCSDFVYKVYYEALGYRMFNSANYLDAVTSAYWLFGEDVALFRWLNPNYTLTEEDIAYGVTTDKQLTTEQARAFMTNWAENLRPGDVIVATGHAMLYIGNGYVVDCWGTKYNETTGVDNFEYEGSVHVLHTIEDLYLEGDDPVATGYVIKDNSDKDWFVVFRPMDAFVTEKSESDPGADIINMAVTDSTASRIQYPGIEIDRTVDITPYGTVSTGEKLTYSVAITNRSNDPDYLTYRRYADADYAGEGYTDLVVTERIPEGTVLVENSISHNGVYADGVITWTVDVAAGECVALTYEVKVTTAAGSTVVNDGGFVADIPSNSLSNRVGGSKLSDEALAGLAALADTAVSNWREQYNISRLGTDLEFAERVYAKAMGIELALPTVQEILDNVFTFDSITVDAGSIRYEGSMTAKLFALSQTVPEAYQLVKAMMVDGYYGGQKLYCSNRGQTMNEFSMAYLEPGDVLVYASSSVSGKVYESKVMVYAGNGKLLCMDSNQTAAVLTSEAENNSDLAYATLWNALKWDVFFVLRPSQVYTDVNTLAYDPTGEPAYGEEPAVSVSQLGSVTLSQENLDKLTALTAEGWTKKNTNFAEEVYAALGIDITSGTKSTSIANILKTALFFDYVGASPSYNYLPLATPAATYEKLAAMLMPQLRGGPDMVGYTDHLITIADLQPGDILNLIRRGSSSYWVCVYQGNGKLLVSEYANGTTKYQTYKIYDFSQDTDGSAFASFITKNAITEETWGCYYVLRPNLGFYDINNPETDPNAVKDDTTIAYAPNLSGFQQVTSMDSIADGHYVIAVLVDGKYQFVTHTTDEGGYLFYPAEGTVTDGVITAENLQYWCIDVTSRSDAGFAVTVANPNGSLYQKSASKSNVAVGDPASVSNAAWTLTYDLETEAFALWNVTGERYLMYSTANTAFKAYASGSATQLPALLLYKYTGTEVTTPVEEEEPLPDEEEPVVVTVTGTQVDSLNAVLGGQYVVVVKYGDKYYAMSQTTDGYLMNATEVQVENGKVNVAADHVWTIAPGTVGADSKTVTLGFGANYLRQSSKSKANVSLNETAFNWTLTYDTASASFRLQSTTSTRYLMYTTGNNGCFKVYDSGDGSTKFPELLLFQVSVNGIQVNTLDDATSGQYAVVAKHGEKYYAMSQNNDGYLMYTTEVQVENGNVVITPDCLWTITEGAVNADNKTVTLGTGTQYLRQSSKSKANVSLQETAFDWALTYDADSASFRLQSSTSTRYLMYTTGNDGCFKVYASADSAKSDELLLFKIS